MHVVLPVFAPHGAGVAWACWGFNWCQSIVWFPKLRFRHAGSRQTSWEVEAQLFELAGRGRIMIVAWFLIRLGWGSVRETSSWAMGPTDGASGWREEECVESFQMHFWVNQKPSACHTPTQSHATDRSCPCVTVYRFCLLMDRNRKCKSLFPPTVFPECLQVSRIIYDCTIIRLIMWLTSASLS